MQILPPTVVIGSDEECSRTSARIYELRNAHANSVDEAEREGLLNGARVWHQVNDDAEKKPSLRAAVWMIAVSLIAAIAFAAATGLLSLL